MKRSTKWIIAGLSINFAFTWIAMLFNLVIHRAETNRLWRKAYQIDADMGKVKDSIKEHKKEMCAHSPGYSCNLHKRLGR